jgi:uncharacterized coiled-coil protein SlyX
MQPNNSDFEKTQVQLEQSFTTIAPQQIRHILHQCGGDYNQAFSRLTEMQYLQQQATKTSIPAPQKRSDRETFSSGSLKLPLLQSEMNKLNEKNISLLEQKIAHQEADISLLKDMIKARDLTIERLQKELQELTSLREREKSSAMVVSDLAQSIKTNVDSSFKNVQDNNGVDFNKLIIEVKKQLAMSFLSDFKDTKIDRSTMGSKINLGSSFMNSPASNFGINPAVPQEKPTTISNLPNISSLNIGLPPSSLPNLSTNSVSSMLPTINTPGIPNANTSILPNSGSTVPISNLYYPPYQYPPSYKYNPFYGIPPTQPSAPSFYPTPGTDPTLKPT